MSRHTRILTATVVIAVVGLLIWLFARPATRPFQTLTDLGAIIEVKPNRSYSVTLPDHIDPDIAITNLTLIGNISSVHFIGGYSPPLAAPLDSYEWDDLAAKRAIDQFRNELPNTKFRFAPGAF